MSYSDKTIITLKDGALLRGGSYRIIRFISAGGFGCTYEAVHTGLKRRVAIKEFFVRDCCNRDPQTSTVYIGIESKKDFAEKLKGKFLDEACAVANLDHPGIVRVTDVFEENGTAYFVMNYIDGRGLNQLIAEKGHLTEGEALRYIRQAANALAYVHGTNRLHLDIKPGNIMIDRNDNTILIDFGMSKQYDEVSGENTSTLLGNSTGYSPLEQLSRKVRNFTPSTDIYALAATLYKAVTGMTPPDAAELHVTEELTFPAHLSAPVVNAIEVGMQMRAKDRPKSIAEFLAILDTPAYSAKVGSDAQATSETTVIDARDTSVKPVSGLPESSEFTSNGLKYKVIVVGKVEVAGQSDYITGKVDIPAKVTHDSFTYDVTAIGEFAFYECESLTSVTIPDSLTTIGNDAFSNCESLTSVTIPDSVTTIGDSAFFGCSSLMSVRIPDSVTTIGYEAFCMCDNLYAFHGKYASRDNKCLIVNGSLNSFAPKGLTSYTILSGVTSIGDNAFVSCADLFSVSIPRSVISIGHYTFRDCINLLSVEIENPDCEIDPSAFAYTPFEGKTNPRDFS